MKQGTLTLTTKDGTYRVRSNGETIERGDLRPMSLKSGRYTQVPKNWIGLAVCMGSELIFTPVKP